MRKAPGYGNNIKDSSQRQAYMVIAIKYINRKETSKEGTQQKY